MTSSLLHWCAKTLPEHFVPKAQNFYTSVQNML